MSTSSKLYLFFTSLMFLFAPLSFGLSIIYFDSNFRDNTHTEGFLINLGLLVILVLVMFLLKQRNKLALPNITELKYLLFGLLSNIVIYFYVFQNSLDIERLMTIYLIVLVILLFYFFIIDKKTIIKELWILSIWFLVLDTIHYQVYYHNTSAMPASGSFENFFITLLYISIPLLGLGIYVFHMKKYKVIDTFTIIAIGIVSLTLLLFTDIVEMNSEFIMTINLILPFVILSDFITMLIYKRFNPLKIAFYLRLYTIMVLIFIYSESGWGTGTNYFTKSSYISETLHEMIGIIYVAIIANLIVFLFHKKDDLNEEVIEEIVEEIIETTETTETILSIDLSTLTITTLKALAKAKGIEGYTKLDKEELINLLK